MPQNKIIVSVKHLIHEIMTNAMWGLVIAIVISLVTNILTILYIFTLQDDLQSLVKKDLLGQNSIQAAQIKLLSIEKELNGLFLSRNQASTLAAEGAITADRRDMEALLTKAKSQYRSKKGMAMLTAATNAFSVCEATIDTLITMAESGATDAGLELLSGDMNERFDAFAAQLHALDNIKQKHDIRVYRNIDYQLSISILFTVIAVIVTIIIRLFLYWRAKGQKTSLKQ
jgi:uncharacterized membrane protein (DUF485 family)